MFVLFERCFTNKDVFKCKTAGLRECRERFVFVKYEHQGLSRASVPERLPKSANAVLPTIRNAVRLETNLLRRQTMLPRASVGFGPLPAGSGLRSVGPRSLASPEWATFNALRRKLATPCGDLGAA